MNDALPSPVPANAFQARQWIADLGAQLAARNILLREPPEEPTSCCGRGCNGCVWEGYLSAVGYWCEQAREALRDSA
ncbi:MAG: oxidoreductase [Proteobacteria bacterium]|nr:oxidoreductase [Pseudomonadota bacterium]